VAGRGVDGLSVYVRAFVRVCVCVGGGGAAVERDRQNPTNQWLSPLSRGAPVSATQYMGPMPHRPFDAKDNPACCPRGHRADRI
jgi:hypothetical protein